MDASERRKRLQEMKQQMGSTTPSASASGGASSARRAKLTELKRESAQEVAQSITSRVDTWLKNNEIYFSNAQNRFSSENTSYRTDTAYWLKTVSKQRENFQKEAEGIKSVLNQYKDVFGQDYVNSVYEALDGNLKAQESIIDAYNKDHEYWSQFASKDEYDTAVRYDGYQKKYAGKSYDEVLSLVSQLADGEEKEWLNANKYNYLANEPDFKEYSQKGASIENPTLKEAEGWANIFGWRPGAEDVGNIVTYSRDNAAAIGLGGMNTTDMVGDFRYSLMTESEVNAYNYYLGKYGEEKASEFLASIDDELTQRHEQFLKTGMKHVAETSPVLSSAISPVMSVFSGAEYLSDLVTGDDRNMMADFSSIIRGTVSEKVDWEIGNWDAFDFVYNTGMSMADSIVATTLFGSAGGVSLGLSAAAQATNDALDRGMSKEDAFWNGLHAGVFEGLFETFSIGKFKSLQEAVVKTGKDVAKNIAKSMITNLSEEAATEIANIVYDYYANGDFSNYEQMVKDYIDAGMSPEDAEGRAKQDLFWQVVESGASGALMGFGMGGIATAGSSINSASQGSEYKKEFGSGVGADLTAEALGIDPNNRFAKKMQSKLESGGTLSNRQIGKLVQQNETGMYENDVVSIQRAVEERLTELGEEGDVTTVAKAIAKQASGQELKLSEKNALKRSMYGQRVVSELNTDNIKSGEYSSSWAEKIGTDRINAEEYGRLIESMGYEHTVDQDTLRQVLDNKFGKSAETAQPAEDVAENAGEATHGGAEETQTMPATENTTASETATGATTEGAEAKDTPITLESESKKYGAQAGDMMHTYNEGQDIVDFDEAYSAAYNMGKSGVNLSYALQSASTAYLTEEQRKLAHAAGVDASNEAAKAQDAKNKAKANGKTGRRKGVVKGRNVSIADLKKAFNDTQNVAYKLLSRYAEATGIDIVLFKSEMKADGDFEGAQGWFKGDEDTIYIDINAGLLDIGSVDNLAKYTMMRTFSHEFTHFIEKWNPIWYNEFRKVVFDTLTERGQNVEALIAEKQEQTGKGYDEASREVVAQAMVDILPDANFIEELATKHKTIFEKLLEMLKEFVAELKAHFASLDSNSPREANALKEQIGDSIKYVENIVKLFDKIAVEAVENYQMTVATEEAVEAPAKVEATTETKATKTAKTTEREHFTITDDAENKITSIKFDSKPSNAVRDILKANAFIFIKAKGEWLRSGKWYGKSNVSDVISALDQAYAAEEVTETPAAETENKSDFAKSFENATQAERDEVVEAINKNTKLSHMTPTEIRETPTTNKEVKPNVENADNQGTVLEPDTDREGTARPLDEVQAEDVRGTGTDGQSVESDREEGSGAGRHDLRADPVSGDRGSDGDGESRDLRNDGVKTHAEAKAYAEEKGYRIELNKLAAKKNIIQVDIYDKQGLPTFNPVIIGELGKTKDGSGWNKVKEAIDRREAADNSAADTNVGDKLHEETAEPTEELTETVDREIAQKSTVEPKGSNFIIGDSLDLPNGDKARHRANVDAIRLIKQLETEGRYATVEEQQILSKYVGWGGLANAFGEMLYNREARKSEMTAKKGWEKEFAELRALVDEGIITEQEYKDMSASTKNAHYTSIEVIKAMYDGLASLGFKGGRMLEPSSGVGNFVGAMPPAMSEKVNSWTMVELDRITGQIAKYLYPNADVRIQGFETANIPDNYMDVAIGNVPFGNFGVVDRTYPKRITKSIHNYFFAKSLDKVRPGGIVMFITSSFTMDSSDSTVRKYIMERADLLGAIRLPNTAFEENAGTEVVTDILVLQKRKNGTEYSGENFLEAEYKHEYGAYVSSYFEQHPEMVLGKAVTKRGMYGANTLTYEPLTDKGTIGEQIGEAFKNIKGEMSYPEKLSREKTNFAVERANKKTKSGGLVVNSDGSISRNENGTLVKVDADEKTAKRIAGMLSIRDAYRKLASYLQQGLVESEIKKARKELNAAYDKFVKEYGYLNAPANKRAIGGVPDRYSILSLENYDAKKKTAKKADIFTKDTISANKTVTHVGNVAEGVIASINLTGRVDTDLIAKLTDKTVEDVTRDIIESRMAFKTRDGGLVAREAYLSGNVRAKLREAEALVPYDADYSNNVEELSRIIPADIPYNEIYITPGSTFIPNEVYADFIAYMLGGRNNNYYGSPDVEVGRSASGEFKIVINNKRLKGNYRNNQEWGTARKSFLELIDAMMGSRTVRVNDMIENPDGKKVSVINEAETEAANEKVKAIQKEFEEWIWKDENRRNVLAKLYNETFNALVNPKYDGSSLSVNGINPMYSLMEHQANAVHRVVASGGNTLLAHRVGAGKTLEMAAAAMKLRELGVVKKPVFVVPKNVVAQWGVEFNNYFPAAKLLVADDKSFTPANRKVFTNMIANGDYDAVIVTYEQFEKIPMSAEYQAKFYEEQISEIIAAIAEEKAESRDGKGLTVKEMEKKKAQLEKKLKELTSKPKDEDNIDFEMLGIDSLFVDEAHNFKNLEYVSKMTNVAGLGTTKGAQRSFDLYTKIRYLQGLNGGRGIVFATATPVMNSMVELYIMQKYLQPDVLNQLGLKSFDAWAKQFGEVVNKWEINPSGTGMRQKQVFANFRNLNELQLLFRSFTDVVTELPYLKIPKMKGGAVKIVECEPGEFQKNYMKALQKRAENVKNVDPSEDNMLKITSDGRKVSYTQRMIDPTLPYEPDCKIFRAVDNIVKEYQESADTKGTQIVFLDMATPKGKDKSKAETSEETTDDVLYDEGSAKLYEDMRNYLVKKGIPKREIAFIHEADTDAKRTQLFEDVNDGKVRVLIGSTGKMGVGMNAQKRVVAIHHLDAPWRPGDVEQRDGRAFRQKNINEEVSKYVYVTKGSFDSRLWDILDRKQHFISQIMNGEDVGRTAEDTGEVTLSAAEVKALASGNPLIEEQTKLTDEIKKLENLQKAYSSSMRLAKTKLSDDITKIANYESSIEKIREDISARKDTYSDGKFSMNIGGKQFTDKKDAGIALAAEIAAKASKDAYVTVAKFAGFELRVIRELAEYKGVIHGKENYKFNVYMNNTTRMVNHIGEVIAGFENMIENQKRMIDEATVDRDAQQKILAQPFEKQTELAEKRARFNEVMELLAPKTEEQLGKTDEDTVQEQSRAYLDHQKYSYEWFTSKPDMAVADVDDSVKYNRADIISLALKNAASVGYTNQNGNAVVHVEDIDTDVIVPKRSLVHGLDRRMGTQAPVLVQIGDILKNSIRVNELIPRTTEIKNAYALIGAAKNQDGNLYIASFVVNKYSNEVSEIDVLYSANAKKESAALLPKITDKSATPTDSAISIAQLLEFVNRYFPDILPEDVLRHFGYESRPDGVIGTEVVYQQRTTTLNDREVLAIAADALEETELTDAERDALRIFKSRLSRLEGLQADRQEQGSLYKEQQFGKNVDREAAKQTLARMQVLDDQIKKAKADILSLEDKKVLGDLLKKARKVVEAEQRSHDAEILKRYRDRTRNAAAIKKYRQRIIDDVGELSNWVLKPDNKNVVKHIPDVLKNSVIPFITSIDFTSKQQLRGKEATKADTEFMKRLNALNGALKQHITVDGLYSGYTDLPPNFMERLQDFIDKVQNLVNQNSGEFVINKMTSEELKQLSDVVRELKSYITQINKFHANAMFAHVYEAGDDTIAALFPMKSDEGKSGKAHDFVFWQQIRPAYAFERFGRGGVAIYDGLRRGQAQLAFNTQKIIEFTEKAYTDKEVNSWEKEIKEIKISAGTVKMRVSDMMSLYELSKQPDSLRHMLGEGMRVATYTLNGKKISDNGHALNEGDITIIVNELTARQKEVADALQKFMAEQGGAWGNEVSVKRFGEQMFTNERYFPINSDGRHLQSTADEHPSEASLYALLNMSFTKSRNEKANNRIVVYSIFDVFANHMASMAQYNAMALPVLDAIKWFNYQQKTEDSAGNKYVKDSVREQMARVYGVAEETRPGAGKRGYAEDFVLNILKAFNGTEAQGVPTDTTGMNALRRYNMAQVAYNFRAVVQQPLAITRAALLLDYSSIIKGMKLKPAAIKQNIDEMRKYSGIAAWKSLGFYDVNISRGLTDTIKHSSTLEQKIGEVGLWGAEKADTLTWAAMWSACKEEVIKKHGITPKDGDFYEVVTELFEDVIYKTQVVDSVLTKNQFLRSKGLFARMTGSFMSEPTTTASMLIDAVDKYNTSIKRGMSRSQAWEKNKRMIGRTMSVYALSAVMLAAVQAVSDAFRDDDDYEEWYEKWLDAFGGNLIDELMPFNKLPIISDFYDLSKELLSVLGVDTYGNPPQSVYMQWYDSLVKGTEIIYQKIAGEDTNYTYYGGIYKLLQAASGIVGLPMATTTREIVTAWNNIIGGMAPSLKLKSYDSGDKNDIKYAYQDGYLTAEEATEMLLEQGLVDNEDEAYFTVQGWEAGDGYSRYDEVYDAVRNGASIDDAMNELLSHGYTEKEVTKQVKTKIGEWYKDGEVSKQQATNMLTKYTDMDDEEITKLVNQWSCVVVTGIKYEEIDDEFMAGKITASRAIEMYVRYGGMEKEKATEKVTALSFVKEHPSLEGESVSYSFVTAYNEYCEPQGIDVELAYDVLKFKGSATSDEGKRGKTAKEKVLEHIDTLDLSRKQKDALYYACGYAKSTIKEAPWR